MRVIKIVDLRYRSLPLKLRESLRVAFATIEVSENILVEVRTDTGMSGYGEAAPLSFVTGETAKSVMAILDILRPLLLGKNPLELEGIHRLMNVVAHGNGSAKCAVDMALHDLWGKAEEKPVYQLLGGSEGTVQSDITIGIGPPALMAERAAHYVRDMGYQILKVKVGAVLEDDIHALTLIRERVGPSIRLRVDANQGYTIETALQAMKAFRPLGVEAVEQPLPAWDIEGTARLRTTKGSLPVMLDESIHTVHDVRRVIEKQAADAINIKLMKCGGLYPATQIAAIAAQAGMPCMVGCMFESRLAAAAGVSLVAAKAIITEADCDSFLLCDDSNLGLSGGFIVDGDRLNLLNEPGFGVSVDF